MPSSWESESEDSKKGWIAMVVNFSSRYRLTGHIIPNLYKINLVIVECTLIKTLKWFHQFNL